MHVLFYHGQTRQLPVVCSALIDPALCFQLYYVYMYPLVTLQLACETGFVELTL